MHVLKLIGSWIAAALLTTVIAVVFQTQNVLSRLSGIGAEISLADRVSMSAYDVLHLGSLYSVFILIATLVAFGAGLILYRVVKIGRPVIFMVAGAVAMIVMLYFMKQAFFGVDLIAGSRDGVGKAFQMLAGAIGGLIFARLSKSVLDAR